VRTARVWFEDLTALCQGLERLRVLSPPPLAGEHGGASAERAAVAEQMREAVSVMTVEERAQLLT
jgi:hypothetical protein